MICKLFLILVSVQVVAAEVQIRSENGTYLWAKPNSSDIGPSGYALRFRQGPKPWPPQRPGYGPLRWTPQPRPPAPCPAPLPAPQPKPGPAPPAPLKPAPRPAPPRPSQRPAPQPGPLPVPCKPTPPLRRRDDAKECFKLCSRITNNYSSWLGCFYECASMGLVDYIRELRQKRPQSTLFL